MNADTLRGQWHQVKGEVKTQWGKLTESDLDQIEGQSEKLIGKIQERYGYARDRAEQEVRDFETQTDTPATRH
jgi:uncharacterized protein YjbJ (UPF0337 family)